MKNEKPLPFEDQPIAELVVHGIPMQVRTERDCEKVSFVLCVRRSMQGLRIPEEDTVQGARCTKCKQEVYRSRTSPTLPPSLCIECAMQLSRIKAVM